MDVDFDSPFHPCVAVAKRAVAYIGNHFSERGHGIVEKGKSWLGGKGGTVGSENLKPNIASCHGIVIRIDSEPDNISIVQGNLPRTYSFSAGVLILDVAAGTRVFSICRAVPEILLTRIAVRTAQE